MLSQSGLKRIPKKIFCVLQPLKDPSLAVNMMTKQQRLRREKRRQVRTKKTPLHHHHLNPKQASPQRRRQQKFRKTKALKLSENTSAMLTNLPAIFEFPANLTSSCKLLTVTRPSKKQESRRSFIPSKQVHFQKISCICLKF